MKKRIGMLLAFFLTFPLAACGSTDEGEQEVQAENASYEVTLYADFTYGRVTEEDDGLIETKEVSLSEEPSAELLAEELTQWTGLDFSLNDAEQVGTAVTLDWSAYSSLIAVPDEMETEEDFQFLDQDALRWFMMDSLYRTLTENCGAAEVYYTMDGGKELTLDALYPVEVFPADIPYMGSPFYFAHDDGRGEGMDVVQDEEESAEHTCGALVRTGSFTGLIPLETNNDFYGGYYYADLTEDRQTVIVNSCFTNDFSGDESMEEYIGRCAELICESQPNNLDIQQSQEKTEQFTVPVYLLSWQTGGNEDTRQWDAMLVTTDLYTYVYAFHTAADHAEEMSDTWQAVFEELELVY